MPSQPKQPTKLPRLPKNAKIHKRPLLRPPIPSPYASRAAPKIVYVTARTPVVAAVKRVRGLLAQVEKRAEQSERGQRGKGRGAQRRTREEETVVGGGESREIRGEEVVVKATGRAVEKALQIGVWFLGQGDVKVVARTGSVGAVDDIEIVEKKKGEKRKREKENEGDGGEDDGVKEVEEVEEVEEDAEEEEVPESRIRFTSMVEIGVSLR